MDEDMIQLRLGLQQLSGEIVALKAARENDTRQMSANHNQNRSSVHDLRDDVQTLSDSVTKVTGELHDYLLVQKDRDEQRDKAWWKAPLGTALIVLVITIAWGVISKNVFHL